uniref:Uncharacterized protein n=1 Tax=Corethron hystrix TaxID=216773 RepID=A0A7S1BE04_9STRA
MIIPLTLSIHVDAVQHDFPCPECLARFGHSHGAEVTGLPSPVDGGLPPAEPLPFGTRLVRGQLNGDVFRVSFVEGGQVDALRVNGDDDCLSAVDVRNGLDGGGPVLLFSRGDVGL